MAGGGGAWKVAYADFVTAMMAFFMVMWLTSQKPEVKEAVAEYFRNPSGRNITGNSKSSVVPNKRDSSGGRRSRATGTEDDPKQSKMTDEGKRTNVGTIIKFDANSIELSESALEKLKLLVPELKGIPQRIEIRGHALGDSRTDLRSVHDALTISYQRSMAAMNYLVEQGIEWERIRLSQAGSSEPRLAGNEIDQSSNARVEVYLLDETFEPAAEKVKRLVSTKNQEPTPAELEAAMKGATSTGADAGHGEKPKGGH